MEEDTVAHIDPDFEPQSRPRSCTWPLHRPDIPMVAREGTDGEKSTSRAPPVEDKGELSQFLTEPEKGHASGGATQRKGTSRRNAWGNQSYADLISQAIENSPEKRLTLAQIYDRIVNTVPYFKDKGDSNSSAGWKNSIRHNLSLHNKFLRVNNETAGQSSWWMLNPEGSKGTKPPRRRAVSMDNSSKLLKSRMRARQTKKQAGMAGPGEAGVSIPADGAVDSPGTLQQFSNWEVQGSNILSHSNMEDLDAWTSIRPRSSSNASTLSTLSGRLSPIMPEQGDEDQLPEDGLFGDYSAGGMPSTLTEALMEELDLIDGLTLMAGQSIGVSPGPAPQAPPKPLHSSAATQPPQVTSFTSFPSLRTPKIPDPPSCPTDALSSITRRAGSNSSFGNALFSPLTSGSSQEAHFRAHVPSALEALLTSDSPPPCDIIMTLTDPLMPSHDGAGPLGPGVKNVKPNSVTTTTLQPRQPSQSHLGTSVPGQSQDATLLTAVKTQFTPNPSGRSGEMLFGDKVSPASGSAGSNEMGLLGGLSCFASSQDRLPADLDLDIFPENMDWDVDSFINSDFMDGEGFDFNFDLMVPTSQGYPGSTTTQASPRSWVPS